MTERQTTLVTLVVYKILLLAIGVMTNARNRSEEDFLLGGRRLGPWVAAISASASSSSAWTLLGVSGAAYAWGLGAAWLFVGCVGGFVLNWLFVARRLRDASRADGSLTVTELLAGPIGVRGRRAVTILGSVIVVVGLGGYVAAQFQAAGKSLESTFDLGATESILVGAAVVVLYTLLGGFWAVSVTDTLQGLLMAASAIVLPIAALVAVGGPVSLVRQLGEISPAYGDLLGGRPLLIGLGFVGGLVGIGLGYPGQPHVVNRFMAMDRDASLARARTIAIVWAVCVYAGMLTLGWCARILLPAATDQDQVFFQASRLLFPPIVSGILLAAVLSAIMSTADSQLLVAASAITRDLGIGRSSPDRMVTISRIVVLLVSCAAVVMALRGSRAIFDQVLKVFTPLGNAFGPSLLVLITGRRLAPTRVAILLLIGFVGSLAWIEWRPDATDRWVDRMAIPILATCSAALLSHRSSLDSHVARK